MATFTDKLIFISLIVFIIASFLFVGELFPPGTLVKISLDNKTVYILPLNEDRIVTVTGPLGKSVIEIKNGKVHFKDALCPGKLSIHQGWKDKGSIICLPNKVTISIGSDEQHSESSEYDAATR